MKFEDLIEESFTAINTLLESRSFSNWVFPDNESLKLEYRIEYEMKGLKAMTGNAFPTFDDFKEAVNDASQVVVTPAMDMKIGYRSRTTNKDDLLRLIRSYRSYPEFRNEQTVDALYDGFMQNRKMKMPLVLRFSDGRMRVLGGNTRMDVAFQLGINPKVLLVDVHPRR